MVKISLTYRWHIKKIYQGYTNDIGRIYQGYTNPLFILYLICTYFLINRHEVARM